jgi:formate C-acetyltransferase
LWIKLAQLHKIWDWSGAKFFGGYQLWQNITISGQDKNGADVTNELSYLVLETQAAIRLHTPSISVRYHDRISDGFLRAAIDVIKLGGGQPALYSDESYIPALMNRGISWDDASDYSIVGCVESIVEGKMGNRPNGAGFVNLTKILELALYNGKDPITGLWPLKGNGDLSTFKSYDELYAAFKKQAEFYLKQQIITDAIIDFDTETNIADPLVSAFVQDCVKRGKTLKEGGSIYDYCGPLYVGVANVGNSLAAIKKLVFDENKLTGAQIKRALESNFGDSNGAALSNSEIRKLLLDAPKYGNDDDYVDSIMRDYFRFVCEETAKYKTTRFGRGPKGCMWQPSTSSVSGNVAFGVNVGATPDGRFAFESLADTTSPYHGTDIKGPTASLKSVSKLPTVLVSGGQLLNMKFTPESLEGDLNIKNFINLIRTFLGDLKGMHVQFNIVSAETLRCAQKTPENYKDLMVRVAGYSALFVTIDKALQDDIIARTEHHSLAAVE